MKNKYIMGADIGGTKISVVIGTEKGRILAKKVLKTRVKNEASLSLKEIVRTAHDLLKSNRISHKNVLGFGFCIPGPIHPKKGVIGMVPNLPGWQGMRIKQFFEKAFAVPVFCHNDAKAACIAEHTFGAGKKKSPFLYMTISTGIGCGIMIDNQILMGASTSAGEIGHMVVELNGGNECGCGKSGCLESVASGTAIETFVHSVLTAPRKRKVYMTESAYLAYKRSTPLFSLTQKSSLSGIKKWDISAAVIAEAARRKDPLAQYAFWRAGYYCGIGIANILQILNPEMIAIGGSVTRAGSLYFSSMQAVVKKYTWKDPVRACTIRMAELGERVADVGVISLVMHGLMKEKE